MKRKVSLVLAMAYKPKLLILDEATSGLDPETREDLMRILVDYVSDGKRGILYITHYLEEVEQIATKMIVLNEGKLISETNLMELENFYTIEKKDFLSLNLNPKLKVLKNEKEKIYILDKSKLNEKEKNKVLEIGDNSLLKDLFSCLIESKGE